MAKGSATLWVFTWLAIALALVFGIFGTVSYSWSSTGRIADRLDVHKYCVYLTKDDCIGLTSTSNLTGYGYIMFDLAGHTLKHSFFLDNTVIDTIEPLEDLAIYGPRTIDAQDVAAVFLPSDSTSLDVTVDEDTNTISGTYRLKTTDRDDRADAKAFVKNPHLYYVNLKTTADPDGAACSLRWTECRTPFDYNHADYP